MLQDRIFDSGEFLRLLQITRNTLDSRTAKAEVAYAFGCPINAHMNEYLPLDAFAVLMTSKLSKQVGLKVAAAAVREKWELWLPAVETMERDKRLYQTIDGTPGTDFVAIPVQAQQFFAFGMRDGSPPKYAVGPVVDCYTDLGDLPPAGIIQIHDVLRQLKRNSWLYEVDLPKKLAVSPDDPEIAAYQTLAARRFQAKAKAKMAKAKEMA